MEQRSEEWFESRRGKFTASEIFKICKPKGFGDTGITYVKEKVGEHFGSFKPQASAKSLQWGIDNEPIAKEYFKFNYFEDIEEIGFLELDNNSGCSPDGFVIGEKAGIEIKCPENPANHVTHLLLKDQNDLKKECENYYWQIQMCLFVTQFDCWYFISFDPRCNGAEKMKVLKVFPEPKDQELLRNRIKEAVELKREMIKTIKTSL